jgi:hypothetical protein
MPGLTLTQAQTALNAYIDAEIKTLAGQEYKIADRSLKNASLAEIREGIKYYNAQVKRLSRGGIKIIGGTPS